MKEKKMKKEQIIPILYPFFIGIVGFAERKREQKLSL